ncbi:(4Fe-4S)-binding protein [Shigella sonnei]
MREGRSWIRRDLDGVIAVTTAKISMSIFNTAICQHSGNCARGNASYLISNVSRGLCRMRSTKPPACKAIDPCPSGAPNTVINKRG